jgi:peptidoglycan/xylan/chitin deacetylase (PgdA/CDA1 family)
VSFGVDVDAVCGWIGTYGGEDSPNDISRGVFAGEVGTPRLLKLFKKYDMKVSCLPTRRQLSSPARCRPLLLFSSLSDPFLPQTTWFIPAHSLLSFPKEMAAVRDAGHEIGMHGCVSSSRFSRFLS